ncbi:MAG: hypothetical protein NT004_15210 [Bacteroidetes bacterium]|nr:hypothetical protein [Bacteroidota bacterium]
MKTKIISLVALLLFFCVSILNSQEAPTKNNPPSSGAISVYCSPELYDLTTILAKEYDRSSAGQLINVVKTEDSRVASLPGTGENIYLISNEFRTAPNQETVFQIVVGREIIAPVISSKNPFLAEILQKGISREAMVKSLETSGTMNWGTLLKNGQTAPVNYYILNDNFTRLGVASFLDANKSAMTGMKSENRNELISALQSDPNAIGFCRLTDILSPNTENMAENIQLLPIDKNGNGKLDYMEDIYANVGDFSRGVWIGKYPKALISNIYSVTRSQPVNESEIAFLRWVLTSGQVFLKNNGYSDLVSNERQSQLDKLVGQPIYAESQKEPNSIASMILILLVVIIVISFIIDLMIRRYKMKTATFGNMSSSQSKIFDENNVVIPGGLYFDKTHTWAFMEQNGTVKIGIDDFLQHITGSITRIEMKKQGDRIRKGEQLCSIIQKGKQLNIYAPVSGTIKAQNHGLTLNSSLLNHAPYSDGWVYQIEPSNWLREIEFLSMADRYKSWLKGEFTRVKDFLAFSIQVNTPGFLPVALQDGGVLKDNVLADFGPQVWEDFQMKFMDVSK